MDFELLQKAIQIRRRDCLRTETYNFLKLYEESGQVLVYSDVKQPSCLCSIAKAVKTSLFCNSWHCCIYCELFRNTGFGVLGCTCVVVENVYEPNLSLKYRNGKGAEARPEIHEQKGKRKLPELSQRMFKRPNTKMMGVHFLFKNHE